MRQVGTEMLTEQMLIVELPNGKWQSLELNPNLGREAQLKKWLMTFLDDDELDVKDIEVTVSTVIHRPTGKSVRWLASSIEDMFFHYKPYPKRIDLGDESFNKIYNGLMEDSLK